MTLTVGSLFAGVAGFEMGLEQAGFEVAWQVEIDKDAVSVLERHYPNVPRWRDVTKIRGADLPPVDVMIGGWPCQDVSVAGKRAGLIDGARSGLFYEFVRIVREMREATDGRSPEFIVGENVPGLLSGSGGRDLARVVAAWAHAGALDVGWRVLDARWFGVAQRRRRVFFVVDFRGERAVQVLFEPPSSSRHPAPSRAAGQGAARDAADGAGGAGIADTVRSHPRPGSNSVGNVAFTLRGNTNGTGASDNAWNTTYIPTVSVPLNAGAHPGSYNGQDASNDLLIPVANSVTASAGHHGHSSPRGDGSDNLIAVAFDWQGGGGGNDESFRGKSRSYVVRAGDYAGSLGATKHDAVAFHLTQDPINGAESPSLGAGNEHGCSTVAVQAGMAVRRLTPRECERLMGWGDDWTRYRADGSEIPDGPRYRMIGNGVVAPVAAWIGRRLRVALEVTV